MKKIILLLLISNQLQSQSIWDNMNNLLFYCDKEPICDCFEERQFDEGNIRDLGRFLNNLVKDSDSTTLVKFIDLYDQVDETYSSCWAEKHTIQYNWMQLYGTFELYLKYFDIKLDKRSQQEKFIRCKNLLEANIKEDTALLSECKKNIYNTRADKKFFIGCVASGAYFKYLLHNMDTYEKYIIPELVKYNPVHASEHSKQIFYHWEVLMMDAKRYQILKDILKSKEKAFKEANQQEEYQQWIERIETFQKISEKN